MGWISSYAVGVLTVLLLVQLATCTDSREARSIGYGFHQSPFQSIGDKFASFISHSPTVFRPSQPIPEHPFYPIEAPLPANPCPFAELHNVNLVNNINSSPDQQAILCGDRFNKQCRNSRYRTLDGSCNNLANPTWGMANTRYTRLFPFNYADGVHVPTKSVSGRELPPARGVSSIIFPIGNFEDRKWTLAAMQYGQIITHDMAMIDGTTQSKAHPTRCCTDEGQFVAETLKSPLCYPIIVPNNDPVYSRDGTKCMNFVRSTTDLDRGCSSMNEPAEQLTVVTHFLDLSLVYGSNDQTLAGLRTGFGGRMIVEVRDGREWPPAATNKSASCDIQSEAEVCYRTGDTRSNQNTHLTILQIILLREHNRIADALAHINPQWTDETIFQEAKRIVTAEHQHITYYEWLPIFLGFDNVLSHKIIYDTKGYVNDYDPNVNPSVLNEHSTASFRYFHSLIAGHLDLVNESRFSYRFGNLRLSDFLNRPGIIEENGNMDDLTRGLATQPQEASDEYHDIEIKQFLFRNGKPLGADLKSIDIQRNRDHGLASYNVARQFAGLPKAHTWADFTDVISPLNVEKLTQLYESPDDVELSVGADLEVHVNGALAGPTNLRILLEQFYRTRVGDRFWYENGNSGNAFTLEQLSEIRKSSLARLLCDNSDSIELMQPRAFEIISHSNPIVRCDQLPTVDLTFWRDYSQSVPSTAGHQHFHSFQKK